MFPCVCVHVPVQHDLSNFWYEFSLSFPLFCTKFNNYISPSKLALINLIGYAKWNNFEIHSYFFKIISIICSFLDIAEKYEYVGRLLKPGEEPTNYSDEEEEGSQQEGSQQENAEKSKDE